MKVRRNWNVLMWQMRHPDSALSFQYYLPESKALGPQADLIELVKGMFGLARRVKMTSWYIEVPQAVWEDRRIRNDIRRTFGAIIGIRLARSGRILKDGTRRLNIHFD